MTGLGVPGVPWFQDDGDRLRRDQTEVQVFAPELTFLAPDAGLPGGGWGGRLPLWPFDRAMPDGLMDLFPRGGLELLIQYPEAYPMIPPDLWPTDPQPELLEHSQARWHVLPTGALCLFQSVGLWQPEASVVDLLKKAAGWRLEYELLKHGLVDRMTEGGIVSTSQLDGRFAELTR